MSAAETLSVVRFSGHALVVVAGVAFSFYAVQNHAFDRMEGYEDFWAYLSYLGFAVTAFGVCGLASVAINGRVVAAFGDVTLLFSIAFVAFAMREVYYTSALAPPESDRSIPLARLRRVEFGFVAVIAVEWLVVLVLDQSAVVAVVKGAGALAFAAYGVAFSEQLESLAHGTALDTLRRHLLLVLVCATGLAVVDLAALLGFAVLADSLEYVFLVLFGGLLVPPTIRLQQSVAGLA